MDKKLKQHVKELQDFDRFRKMWLILSLFVIVSIVEVVFQWKVLESFGLIWAIGSAGIVISAAWWYWTMRLIRLLLGQRLEEAVILHDLVISIKEVNHEVKKAAQYIDNLK